jgi:phosphoserine phosphatase
LLLLLTGCSEPANSVLLSWADGPAKAAVLSYVDSVTQPRSPDFLPPAERIAVFDHDGTLWAEQPVYFQTYMIYEKVLEQAPMHPEWQVEQPFKAVLEHDQAYLMQRGYAAMRVLSAAVTKGMATNDYLQISESFARNSVHPELNMPFAGLTYAPMLELVQFLHENSFQVFIVSGGDIDFIRGFSEQFYGIPRERVIGSSRRNELSADATKVLRGSAFASMNVNSTKVLNIDLHIGRIPVFAVGNSDGDLAMLAYTASHGGFALLLDHDDAAREYSYRDGAAKALEAASLNGWTVVSMRNDFLRIFNVVISFWCFAGPESEWNYV